MTNRSKAKGTAAEGEVLRWLIDVTGYPLHRNVQHGNRDIGDIGGLPGTVIEVKSGKPTGNVAYWLAELAAEKRNADAQHSFVVWRTPGTTNPALWVVLTDVEQLEPRHPIPGPATRLAHNVRSVAGWPHGVAGLRFDGNMPAGVDACQAAAMTGHAFEQWLADNIDGTA